MDKARMTLDGDCGSPGTYITRDDMCTDAPKGLVDPSGVPPGGDSREPGDPRRGDIIAFALAPQCELGFQILWSERSRGFFRVLR